MNKVTVAVQEEKVTEMKNSAFFKTIIYIPVVLAAGMFMEIKDSVSENQFLFNILILEAWHTKG